MKKKQKENILINKKIIFSLINNVVDFDFSDFGE